MVPFVQTWDTILRYQIAKNDAGLTITLAQLQHIQDLYRNSGIESEADKSMLGALNEYTNDFISGLFATEDGVKELEEWLMADEETTIEEKQTFLQTLAKFFNQLIQTLKNFINSREVSVAQREGFNAEANFAEDIRQRVLKAVDNLQNMKQEESETVEETKTDAQYSVTDESVIAPDAISKNIETVSTMQPVCVIENVTKTLSQGKAGKIITEHFNNIGNTISVPGVGKIIVNEDSVKSIIAHSLRDNKIMAALNAEKILPKGKIVYYGQKSNSNVYDMVIAAPITINDGRFPGEYLVGYLIKVNKENNKFYLSELVEIKNGYDNSLQTGSVGESPSPGEKSYPSVISILNSIVKNKPHFSLTAPIEEEPTMIAVHNVEEKKPVEAVEN